APGRPAPAPIAGFPPVHRRRTRSRPGLAGRMLRRQGGDREGPRRPGRAALGRCGGHPRRRRAPPAGGQRHRGGGGGAVRGTPLAPVDHPRRRPERGDGGGRGMRKAHDVATVRAAEQALMATVPPGALMQRAAAGLAAVCAGLAGKVYGARIVVLAGSGDNGGDALYAAGRLARRGARVPAVPAAGRVHEGATAALRGAGGRVTGPDDPGLPGVMAAADLVLDGLLGIGGHGGLREPYSSLAGLAARAGGRPGSPGPGPLVVAVD